MNPKDCKLDDLSRLANPEHVDFLFEYLSSLDRDDRVASFKADVEAGDHSPEAFSAAWKKLSDLLSHKTG